MQNIVAATELSCPADKASRRNLLPAQQCVACRVGLTYVKQDCRGTVSSAIRCHY